MLAAYHHLILGEMFGTRQKHTTRIHSLKLSKDLEIGYPKRKRGYVRCREGTPQNLTSIPKNYSYFWYQFVKFRGGGVGESLTQKILGYCTSPCVCFKWLLSIPKCRKDWFTLVIPSLKLVWPRNKWWLEAKKGKWGMKDSTWRSGLFVYRYHILQLWRLHFDP